MNLYSISLPAHAHHPYIIKHTSVTFSLIGRREVRVSGSYEVGACARPDLSGVRDILEELAVGSVGSHLRHFHCYERNIVWASTFVSTFVKLNCVKVSRLMAIYYGPRYPATLFRASWDEILSLHSTCSCISVWFMSTVWLHKINISVTTVAHQGALFEQVLRVHGWLSTRTRVLLSQDRPRTKSYVNLMACSRYSTTRLGCTCTQRNIMLQVYVQQ